MELNLTNMKDLEFICDVAAARFRKLDEEEWAERAREYGVLFRRQIAELEKEE